MLSGFGERKSQIEQQNLDEAHAAQERESRVYEALINSPNPDIKAAAVTGLLQSAQPNQRKSGIAGWLGQMQAHPAFAHIQNLVNTPETVEEPVMGLPSRQTSGYIGQPPSSVNPDALAATSPTTGGPITAPRPGPTNPSITRELSATPIGTRSVTRPRQVFATPEETARATSAGQYSGRVQGIVGAIEQSSGRKLSPDEVKQIGLELSGYSSGSVGSAPFQSIAGEITKPDGSTEPAFGIFDRQSGGYKHPITGQPLPNFRPRTTTGSRSLGTHFEIAAHQFGYASGSLVPPEKVPQVEQLAQQLAQQEANASGLGRGAASITTDLNKPIGPTAGQQYNVPPTTTLADLATHPGMTEAEKIKIGSLAQADDQIAEIERLVTQVFPDVQPGIAGRLASQLSLGMQHLSASEDLSQLDAAVNLASINIARIAGETGRIPVQLVTKAQAALAELKPSLFGGDTRRTALAKLQIVKELLATAKANAPGTGVGTTPPSPTRPQAAAPAVGTSPPGATQTGSAAGPANLFNGPDGQLHTGSPTGPLYR